MKRLVLGILVGAGLVVYGLWHFSGGGAKDPVEEVKRALSDKATGVVTAVEGKIEESFDEARAGLEKTRDSVKAEISDARVAATVKTRLIREENIDGFKLNVDVRGGVVTLKGEVKSTALLSRAVKLAGEVEGVTDVKSELTVAD